MNFVGGKDALALVAISLALDLAILAMDEMIRVETKKFLGVNDLILCTLYGYTYIHMYHTRTRTDTDNGYALRYG